MKNDELHVQFWLQRLDRTDLFSEICAHGRIILELILEKQFVKKKTGSDSAQERDFVIR
jgi:hypothetical protein